jgi:hypothetical protein
LVRRCVIVGLLQCVGVHALCMCFYVLNRLYSYAMQFERVQKKKSTVITPKVTL